METEKLAAGENGETITPTVYKNLPLEIGAWAIDAACREKDGRIFFPEEFHEKGLRYQKNVTQIAKATCNECPVRMECLEFALENHEELVGGIFGGYTHEERTVIRNRIL